MADRVTRFVELRDGRRLAYMELGRPDGYPIVHHHGMPGSRLQHEADPDLYTRLGVWVITPDRPGYGLSDRHPDGRLLDWAEDVRELMDSLRIERFGITALSGGGIYGLACAFALGNRVSDVALAGCPAPMQMPDAFRGMRLMTRTGVWLAGHLPWLMERAGDVVSGFVRKHPRFTFEQFNRDVPPADRRWLSTRMVSEGAIEDVREALRHGASGYTHDLEMLARPWGFDLSRIRVPVGLWHGDADVVIPPQHGAYLARVIPGARLHVCPGEAHLLMWNHLPEILLTAAGRETAIGLADGGRSALNVETVSPDTRVTTKVEVN